MKTPPNNSQSPAEVEYQLRPIFIQVQYHRDLEKHECKILAEKFIYKNVISWVCDMRPPLENGRACQEHCPVTPPGNCDETDVAGPADVMHADGDDFCPKRLEKQPWSLQVYLLWNTRRESGGKDGSREGSDEQSLPSVECALAVYRSIVNKSSAKENWSAIRSLERPTQVEMQWRRVVDEVLTAFSVLDRTDDGNQDQRRLERKITEAFDPGPIVGLVMRVNNVLSGWRGKQGALRRSLADKTEQIVVALGKAMLPCYRHGWPFPTQPHQKVIQELVDLLKKLSPPGWQDAETMLGERAVTVTCQRVVLDYLQKTVLPMTYKGLDPGNPLNDPVVQDLFWYHVGSQKKPEWEQPFNLTAWCNSRYGPDRTL